MVIAQLKDNIASVKLTAVLNADRKCVKSLQHKDIGIN